MPRRRYSRGYAKSRRRYGSKGGGLTGGTGDVNPQYFNLTSWLPTTAVLPAAGDASSVESIVPLQQQALMASRGSKSMVMELLAVEFTKDVTTVVGTVALTTRRLSGTVPASDLAVNQPHVIASMGFGSSAGGFLNGNLDDDGGKGCIDLTDQVLLSRPLSTRSFVTALISLIRPAMVLSSAARRSI